MHGCEEEEGLDDMSASQLRELVLVGRKRIADLKKSTNDQAVCAQFRFVNEYISSWTGIKCSRSKMYVKIQKQAKAQYRCRARSSYECVRVCVRE